MAGIGVGDGSLVGISQEKDEVRGRWVTLKHGLMFSAENYPEIQWWRMNELPLIEWAKATHSLSFFRDVHEVDGRVCE